MMNKSTQATITTEPSQEFLEYVNTLEISEDGVKSLIDGMSVSADTKALLYTLSSATIKAGKFIVKIGRKVLNIIFELIKSFPALSFGVIFGILIGALIAAIPVVGVVLGPIAVAIAPLIGATLGGLKELENNDLGLRVKDFVNKLTPLAA